MRAFRKLAGIAAPLPLANVDTDKILPGQYLKTLTRRGLGKCLFAELRYGANGEELPDFILNQAPFRNARILVAGENFGCGSSREHAPWALLDFGIECVIAPSFADIFYNNCLKNGILPIRLAPDIVDALLASIASPGTAELIVDLAEQTVTACTSPPIRFEMDPAHKRKLLDGRDEIDASLALAEHIARHEAAAKRSAPWVRDILF